MLHSSHWACGERVARSQSPGHATSWLRVARTVGKDDVREGGRRVAGEEVGVERLVGALVACAADALHDVAREEEAPRAEVLRRGGGIPKAQEGWALRSHTRKSPRGWAREGCWGERCWDGCAELSSGYHVPRRGAGATDRSVENL